MTYQKPLRSLNTVYRCDWCGRFYSSSLPEPTACPDHIPEHNTRSSATIDRWNEQRGFRHRTTGE